MQREALRNSTEVDILASAVIKMKKKSATVALEKDRTLPTANCIEIFNEI